MAIMLIPVGCAAIVGFTYKVKCLFVCVDGTSIPVLKSNERWELEVAQRAIGEAKKMKSVAALFACFVASSTFAADAARFEKQLRSDLLDILKTRWSAQKASDVGDAYADQWLLDLKNAYPELLPDEAEPTIPTDPYLRILQDEAAQHHRPKLKGEI